ncbi:MULTISPECIES: aromatic ring-hydroxylating dioxygenase subunit alpha [unclassified Achromobacter]|uniref:aromatic ring-hydroxylating oxygenase subunit alpha n=1 Tax=unclassified Achromobacter TaxID=2626865 RepID=UPI0013035233|nr:MULTISPECIES: Rieske 2Fe-2S domain-containing protein [unclassified Achromobacter]
MKITKAGLPLPFGWFFVAQSSQVTAGTVSTVKMFEQEWVLFRNQEGTLGLIEAHCPHLGAHLGMGGTVDGNSIRCPFHDWAFDTDGRCTDIPYAIKNGETLKKRAHVGRLPVKELDGIIWAWFHPGNTEPAWPINSQLPPKWQGTTPRQAFAFEINCHIQEILENAVDYPHLFCVHGNEARFAIKNEFNGLHRKSEMADTVSYLDDDGKKIAFPYLITVSQTGPGQGLVYYRRMVEIAMLFLATPISSTRSVLRFVFYYGEVDSDPCIDLLIEQFINEKIGKPADASGVYADIPIWENKVHREHPLLCDADGPVMQFRSWFGQFYPAN